MYKQIKTITKIKGSISLIIPFLWLSMFLPVWNGKGLIWKSFNIFDFIQIIAFVLAAINIYYLFVKKIQKNQVVFDIALFVSASLLFFFGIFFIENLMGIPPIPPQD